MKQKFIQAHMRVAYIYASLSSAERLKVGCIIVKGNKVLSIGYNGTPEGWDNKCEDEEGKTLSWVSHAEENALTKLCSSHDSSEGAELFVTHSPCINCAKLIANSKIKKVYFHIPYRDSAGLDYLEKCGVEIEQVFLEQEKDILDVQCKTTNGRNKILQRLFSLFGGQREVRNVGGGSCSCHGNAQDKVFFSDDSRIRRPDESCWGGLRQ